MCSGQGLGLPRMQAFSNSQHSILSSKRLLLQAGCRRSPKTISKGHGGLGYWLYVSFITKTKA